MKPHWAAMGAFLVGLVLGPPRLAVVDAGIASLHETNGGSGRRLIRNYADASPPLPLILGGYPDWLNDRPKGCPIVSTHNERVLLQDDDLDQLQKLDNAWTALYDRELNLARAEALEKLSGPFQRTILADCLSFPAYAGACHPIARRLIARADLQSRAKQQSLSRQLFADFSQLRCTMWAKAAARKGG